MLQWSVTHSNSKVFEMTQVSPRIFTVTHTNPRAFTLAHINARLFAVTHTNPKLFALTHTNPRLFAVTEIWTPCYVNVFSITPDAVNYAPGSEISFDIEVMNTGGEGQDTIDWELIDSSDNVIDSDTVSSGTVKWRSAGTVQVSDVTAPETYKELRVRARGSQQEDWVYSSTIYVLPVDLSVTATHPGSDIYWPGTTIDCHVHITNAGFSGSETIEWQLIRKSDSVVLSSGSQSSGTIGDFASTQVSLSGIVSPSGGNIMFNIRARITGATEWVTSMQMGNYLFYTPPPNPEPRG